MQVQSISTANNYPKTNFKAKFVYDRAGNFRSMWESSSKSSELNSVAEQFSKIKNGVLQIKAFEVKPGEDNYVIFNHSTKKEKKIAVPIDRGCNRIENLINKLMEDMDFFKVSKRANFVKKTHAEIPTFIKDQNGYFEQLFESSPKSQEYADKVAKFTESTEKGTLEVYDMNKFTGGKKDIFDRSGNTIGSEKCREYDIINRKTGTYNDYIILESVEYKLENLLDQILNNRYMREPNGVTSAYRNLLGLK